MTRARLEVEVWVDGVQDTIDVDLDTGDDKTFTITVAPDRVTIDSPTKTIELATKRENQT